MPERLNEQSKWNAYNAGIKAKREGLPVRANNGWGYPRGLYYNWFVKGWHGKPFRNEPISDDYAMRKARQLIADEFRSNGQEAFAKQYENGGFITNPLLALAKYIARVE